MGDKKILCCDIDGVIVQSNEYWYNDLILTTKKQVDYTCVKQNYNLTEAFQPELSDRGFTGFEWWKSKFIYDDMEPMDGAVDTLRWASQWVDIFFVSVVLGGHGGSKHEFLERYFPFHKASFWTKEKGGVKHDYAIDDRVENINRYDKEAIKILFDNGCCQTASLTTMNNVMIVTDWESTRFILEEILEIQKVGITNE